MATNESDETKGPKPAEDDLSDIEDPVLREFASDPRLARDARLLDESRRELLAERWYESDEEKKKGGKKSKRLRRPIWVSLLMLGVCLYFITYIWRDVAYFLQPDDPTPIGDAVEYKGTTLSNDSYVVVSGVRNPGRGINLGGSFMNDRNVFQLVGTKLILIDSDASNEPKGEMLESHSFAGRLVRFKDMPYYRAVRDFAVSRYGVELPAEAIVVRANDRPGDHWPMALSTLALGGILFFNLLQLVLWFRRPKRS